MKDIKLYFTALLLLPIVNFVNKRLVKKKGGNLEKYDIDRAISIDKFAGREYRTFFNHYLVKPDSDYKIGVENETISSALGKIKVDGKLTFTHVKGGVILKETKFTIKEDKKLINAIQKF